MLLQLTLCLLLTCGVANADESATEAIGASPADSTDHRQLVWSDEFERDGAPDEGNWNYERGFVRNEELQWYQPENARCAAGLLVIEGRRERTKNLAYDPGSRDWRRRREHAEYTSASLTTRGKHDWLYGRLEMRARIDARPGLWPAFWTLGSAQSWPGCGEVDIMEYYDGKLLANAAWRGRRGRSQWDEFKRPLEEFGDSDWAKQFHTWRMEWTPASICLRVDDQLLNEISLDQTVNSDRERANPFREPHYVILNLAIGGTRGGDPGETRFPARFEVDYVRVYQDVTIARGDSSQ
jgi:beta-glucanase (GH16 family)